MGIVFFLLGFTYASKKQMWFFGVQKSKIVQTSILEKRLKEIDTKQAKIISEDEIFKALDAD